MDIVFDPAKDVANIVKHGLSLSDFKGFDEGAIVVIDDRYDYDETRFQARGRIGGKAYCLAYTTSEAGIRLISLRRAHEKEMRRYEQAATPRRL